MPTTTLTPAAVQSLPPVTTGDVARRSLGLLRRRGRLVSVWTNAQRWVEEAGGWGWLGKARCAVDMAAWWVVRFIRGSWWVECFC